MSDAFIILDSEEEKEEEEQNVEEETDKERLEKKQTIDTLEIEDDEEEELLFDNKVTRIIQVQKEKNKNDRHSFSLYFDDLKATASPSPPPIVTATFSDNDFIDYLYESSSKYIKQKKNQQRRNDTSQYEKYLRDSSPEEEDTPLPTTTPVKKKRTLKNPIPIRREKSIDSDRNKRENSFDLLEEESNKIISTDPSEKSRRGKQSLRNPIPKRKNSVDELLDASMNNRRDDLFLSDESEQMSYNNQKKVKQDDSDSDGDNMGTSKNVSHQSSFKIDSINLLSDDSEEEDDETVNKRINRNKESTPPRRLKRSSLFRNKNDTTDSFFFDDELEKTKNKSHSRKNSVDQLLEDTLLPTTSSSLSPPPLATRRRRLSLEKLVYGSDTSPENSPTLQPKKTKKVTKKKKSLGKQKEDDDDDLAELSDHDLEEDISLPSNRLDTMAEKSKEPDHQLKSNFTISIDDSDDDGDFGNSGKRPNDSSDNDSDNDGGIQTEAFFNELMSLPKKRRPMITSTTISKKQKLYRSLESEASSSKPIPPMIDYDDDDDMEPMLTDRKGKKRADEYRLRRSFDNNDDDMELVLTDRKGKKRADEYRSSCSFVNNDILSEYNSQVDEDTLTLKEKRHLQSLKKKEEAQRKREEKQRQKEQKKLEKERVQLYEKANKIKNNRTEIVKEMIVDIHPDFLLTKPGQIIKDVFESGETQVSTLDHTHCHTMSWRRKCTAEWDLDSQSFIPLHTTKLTEEPFVLIHFEVNPFVQHIVDNTLNDLIKRVKTTCKDKQVILMIEGLEVYYRKKTQAESRRFQQAVRQSLNENDEETSSSNTSSRRKKTSSVIDIGPSRLELEEILVQLQMMDDIMLVPTKDDEDSAEWLKSLTIDMALGRYKSKNLNNTYRVSKTGHGASDSFSKMLQEIHLCTPAIANSVISAYPTAQSLYQSYKKTSRGDILLADLQVERSAVQSRDRTINNVMSKKIYTIFTCPDPEHVIF